MGRELKRVALDFAWPLNEVWTGYLNPHYVQCGACHGRGETPARRRLGEIVSLLMIAGEDSLRGRNHPYFHGANFDASLVPSPEFADLTTALTGRAPVGRLGHDALDRWAAMNTILTAAKLDPKTWGVCAVCHGDGMDPPCKAAYEAWAKTEPPSGEGYQVWETVSEGSPISPVFTTAEICEAWLVAQGYSSAAAQAFMHQGWVPSMVLVHGQLYKDIDSATLNERSDDACPL